MIVLQQLINGLQLGSIYSLIALGSGAAFIYSTVMLFVMTRAQVDGNMEKVMEAMMAQGVV